GKQAEDYSRNAALGDALADTAQASASVSAAVHPAGDDDCARQSPLVCAFAQALVNLSVHFWSLAASGVVPVDCALAITPALHAIFLPSALVMPPSHFDGAAAKAMLPAPMNIESATPITIARICFTLRCELEAPWRPHY